jgi:hypothetical protein
MDKVEKITKASKNKKKPAPQKKRAPNGIKKAMQNLNAGMSELEQRISLPFEEFLKVLVTKPSFVMRDVFQVFHDMVKAYVGEGIDEYPDDPESIQYVNYDCSKLFVEGSDYPFFADRLFANRLVKVAEALKRGAQQNKIYIFEGPPGCGKSTFLNNLLMKFEEYANTEAGMRYETVWRFDRNILGSFSDYEDHPIFAKLSRLLDESSGNLAKSDYANRRTESGNVSRGYFDESYMPY